MKKYGLVKLSNEGNKSDNNISIVCTWNENVINRIISDATNTICIKDVKDLITGEIIKPNPFIFDITDSINVKEPMCLTYSDIYSITEEEARKYIEKMTSEDIDAYNKHIIASKRAIDKKKNSRNKTFFKTMV